MCSSLHNNTDFDNDDLIHENGPIMFNKSMNSESSVPACTFDSVGKWGDTQCSPEEVSLPPTGQNKFEAILPEKVEFETCEAPINISEVHDHILFSEIEIQNMINEILTTEPNSMTWVSLAPLGPFPRASQAEKIAEGAVVPLDLQHLVSPGDGTGKLPRDSHKVDQPPQKIKTGIAPDKTREGSGSQPPPSNLRASTDPSSVSLPRQPDEGELLVGSIQFCFLPW